MEWLDQSSPEAELCSRSPGHPAENWAFFGHVLLPSLLCIFPIAELQPDDKAQYIPAGHYGVHPKYWGQTEPPEATPQPREPRAMRNNIPGDFSSPSVTAAAFPIPGWSQGSWFHLSSFWLFQALWWHHYRFPPTQAAWILGILHTAFKWKDTCQR